MARLNDEERPDIDGRTVLDLLRSLDPALPIAVVRIGGDHLPRSEWGRRVIGPDDDVRVVYIIAGG